MPRRRRTTRGRRELQDAIGEASADEAAALRELGDIRSRRRELDAAVAGFDAQIRGVEAKIATIQADVDRFTAEAVAREAEAAAARAQLDEAKRRVAEAAAAMYRGEDGAEVYAEVLDVDNLQDAFSGTKYLAHLSEQRRAEVESLAGLKVQIEALQQQAAVQRDEAKAKQAEAEGERAQLAELRAEQQHQRDAVAKEEASERALVASIQSRKDQFADELASLQATSTVVSQFLAARQRGQKRASSFHVVRPVPGAITGGFGNRVHPILGTVRVHTGVDMSAAQGHADQGGRGRRRRVGRTAGRLRKRGDHRPRQPVRDAVRPRVGGEGLGRADGEGRPGGRPRGLDRHGDRPAPALRGAHPRRPGEPRQLHVATPRRAQVWIGRTSAAPAASSSSQSLGSAKGTSTSFENPSAT